MSESNKPLIDPEAQKLIDRAHKVKTDNLALFNIKEFTYDPNKIEEIYIEKLGLVRFKRLIVDDITDLRRTSNEQEYIAQIIFRMLHKADSSITYSDVTNLAIDVASKLYEVLAEKAVFLKPEPIKTLKSGLTKT